MYSWSAVPGTFPNRLCRLPTFSCWKGWYKWLLTSLTALALMTGRPGMVSICCMLCCGACWGMTMTEGLAWWWGSGELTGTSNSRSLLRGVLRTPASESSLHNVPRQCLTPHSQSQQFCALAQQDVSNGWMHAICPLTCCLLHPKNRATAGRSESLLVSVKLLPLPYAID